MKRNAVVALVGAIAAVVTTAVAACGGGIGAGESPELVVDNVELMISDMSPSEERNAPGDVENLVLRNNGPGAMEVTKIEWVDRPERVVAYYSGEETADDPDCQTSADCSGDGICLTDANQCRDRGFRSTSDTISQDATFEQSLALLKSDVAVSCPEADGDDLPENYCGAIEIETNAENDGDNVEMGNTTIYLVSDGTSGHFEFGDQSSYLEYTFATPDVTQTKEFEIENNAASPLTIDNVNFSQNASWFEATPTLSGLEIPGHTTETISLDMTPDETADTEDLNFTTDVQFDTSSVAMEPGMTVRVTDGPGDAPLIEVEPLQLSFEDGEPKTLTVKNYGRAGLPLYGMEIRPHAVEEHYRVTHGDDEGQNLLDGASIPNVAGGDEDDPAIQQFQVHLDNPDADSTVGELRINHGDDLADNVSFVTLLGDAADVAVGNIAPSRVDFRSDGGQDDVQVRHLALSNTGNTPLDITGVDIELLPGSSGDLDTFDVETLDGDSLAGLTVPAGGIQEVVVSYKHTDDSVDYEPSISVKLESNHAGQSDSMEFGIVNSILQQPGFDIELMPGFGDGTAAVGAQTSFSVVSESSDARLDNASWYVHQRPAGSEAVIEGAGEQVTMLPDEAGTYRISVIVDDETNTSRELQKVLEFEAVDS